MGLDKWTTTKPFMNLSYHAVAYGKAAGIDQFVVVGPYSQIRSQDEGASWTNDSTSASKVYYGIAYGNGVFAAVGGHTTSWNGSAWSAPVSQTVSGATKFLRAVVYGAGPGLFVAVGDAGTILTSPDGVNWTTRVSPVTADLRKIAYGNQLFVVGGDAGQVLTSSDGVTWTAAASTSSYFRALTFGTTRFFGIDNTKIAWTSSNGASWTNVGTLASADPTAGIENADGLDAFGVVGANGSIHTSEDGIAWTKRTSGSSQHLGGIGYGKNRFVAVGALGDIVRSDEFPSTDLSMLTCSGGPLMPAFNPLVTAYGARLTGNVASVTPTSQDPMATIAVRIDSGAPIAVQSGSPSAASPVPGFRGRTFFVTVTARNGLTTKVYTLNVAPPPPPVPRFVTWLLSLFWPWRS